MIFTVSKFCRPVGLATLVIFALVRLGAQPLVVGRPATVVFAPWVTGAEAIARATVGASLLTRGGTAFAVTVIPERADYATIVAASGAWFATGLARRAGCAKRVHDEGTPKS